MFFDYPQEAHTRQYGPMGYTTYEAYKPWLRDEFTFRCAYCLTRERWSRSGHHAFSVEHVIPRSIDITLSNDYTNLIYACVDCNSLRQDKPVLDPFATAFGSHIRIDEEGTIRGLTTDGIAHIQALKLDSAQLTEFRKRIIQTIRQLENDPNPISIALLHRWLGFPDDLPNLAILRPPSGNSKPNSVQACHYEQRKRNTLATRY